MDKQEIKKLLGMMQIHYPSVYKDYDTTMLKIAVDSWHYGLHDLDASLVFNIVTKIIVTDKNPFPPKLAVIREECLKAMSPTKLVTPLEAWEIVNLAVKDYGWSNESKAMESFSQPIQRAVKNIGGWQKICATNLGQPWDFLKKDFLNVYEEFNLHERQEFLMPQGMLQRLQELSQKPKELVNEQQQMPEV